MINIVKAYGSKILVRTSAFPTMWNRQVRANDYSKRRFHFRPSDSSHMAVSAVVSTRPLLLLCQLLLLLLLASLLLHTVEAELIIVTQPGKP